MKRITLVAIATAGAALAGAAPGGYGQGAGETASGYPACSRTVTDRCIQLYERGVRARENLAMNARLGPGREPATMSASRSAGSTPAVGGPLVEVPMAPAMGSTPRVERDAYPPCSRTITDRCIQMYERGRR
jgi:hypothetical protein